MSAGDSNRFDGLCFTVVRVKYAGPTDRSESRWIASSYRGAGRIVRPYDSALSSGSSNARPVAEELFARIVTEHGNDPADYVAVPGELSADEYVFTFVLASMIRSES